MFNFKVLIITIFLVFPLNQEALELSIQIDLLFDCFKSRQKYIFQIYMDLK